VSSAVVTIETPELGDRSYLVHDGEAALVVDPQRDIERVLTVAEAVGVQVTHVAETHLHNDYVSGGRELARETGAAYLVAGAEKVAFDRTGVHDGDTFPVGALTVSVIATPGHTPHHVSYVVGSAGRAEAVFTGGSLLHGSVGRTDLGAPGSAETLAREQYRSVRKLAVSLEPAVAVHPTHGFGSFCSTGPRGQGGGTIGDELASNVALEEHEDEDGFVARLLAGPAARPAYYQYMAAVNAAGAEAVGGAPVVLSPGELAELLRSGAWVVDLRDRASFAREHLSGSVSFEQADGFATSVGWVVPWGSPISLVAASPDRLERARRDLSRIGIDRLRGVASGSLETIAGGVARTSYPVSDFVGLAKDSIEHRPVVLDVRRDEEWDAGHIDGAVHIFAADLPGRLDEVPAGQVWTHCTTGYRASIAASLLHRAGRDVVLVDDEWASVLSTGLPVVAS
jgi:hydroxyacylglutathione hydrolase